MLDERVLGGNGASIAALNRMQALPALEIRRSTGDRETWTVRATWEDGTFEEIAGFESQAEADEWIVNKFQIWLEEINKARAS